MAKSNAKKTTGKSEAKGVDAVSIVEDEFGNYKIRAGRMNGVFVARAFPRHSAKSQGLMAEAKGSSESDAIDALKALLTEREAERTAARRMEPQADLSVPTQEEFFDALGQTKLSPAQRAMLKAQAVAGEEGLIITAVMTAGSYKSQDAALKSLTKAGRLMADFIGLEVADAMRILGYRVEGEGTLHLVMHEELRNAVWQTL